MSNEDLNYGGAPWLGGLYQKLGKVYDEIDHSMSQDTVKYARSQLQTVGENVRKLGSHVMFDLPLTAFLASKSNAGSTLGENADMEPEIDIEVADIKCPANDNTEQLSADEGTSSSFRKNSRKTDGIHFDVKDDDWFSENLEVDSRVRNVSTSEAPIVTSSGDDTVESSLLNSSSSVGQDAEDEIEDNTSSSTEGPESTDAHGKHDVKSLTQSVSINKDQEDDNKLFTPVPLTTNDPQSELARPAERSHDPAVECASDVSTVLHCSELASHVASCESESENHVSIFSSSESERTNLVSISSGSSALTASLNVVEASFSGQSQTEDNTFNNHFDPSSRFISLCTISASLDSPLTQPSMSYLMDSTLSSFTGQSNSSCSVLDDLTMEKIDLSDDAELDLRHVAVNNDMNLVVSSRRGSLYPYKKRFRNPFASKKQLEKDYKLLSIWYGDIDAEFSQLTQSNRILNSGQKNGVGEDTEWEIV